MARSMQSIRAMAPGAAILLEQRRLLDVLDTLERRFTSLQKAADAKAKGALLLDTFIQRLKAHFVAEAATPLDAAELKSPSLLQQLHALDAEHPRLLRSFQRALLLASDARTSFAQVRAAVRRGAEALRRHEAAEDALFYAVAC